VLKGLDLASVISNDTKETIFALQKEPEKIEHNFFSS